MIAASHIYQMMLDADVSNVKCLTFANADVAEFTVKNGSRITKCAVKDAGLPKGATIGGLIRNGEGILVTGNTVIQPNDHVVVFCLGMMIKKIENSSIDDKHKNDSPDYGFSILHRSRLPYSMLLSCCLL